MTFDFAGMIADREAGTPGDWAVDGPTWNQIVWTDNETRLCFMAHSNGLNDDRDEANARRIARVPLLEAEINRLTARVAELTHALNVCLGALTGGMDGAWDGDEDAPEIARAALSTHTEEPKT